MTGNLLWNLAVVGFLVYLVIVFGRGFLAR